MTQKVHWLAALALLLAFGAGNVRAEEEEEVAPPVRTAIELLPAPHAVSTAAAAPHCASCCQGCPSCASCPQCQARTTPVLDTQYIVKTRIVHASPDGDCEEIMSPNLTVFGGQTACVQCVHTPSWEPAEVGLMIQVSKQAKQIRLNLGVEESKVCDDAPAGQPSRTTMRLDTASNVTLGKMKRLVFTKHANGSDASWAEVMVTTIPPEADAEDSPLDCVNEALGDLIDTVADVATSLFGDDAEVQQAEFATPVIAAPRDFPVAATTPCPACKQCAAVEAIQTTAVHLHIDAKNNRTRVEVRSGTGCWKGSAKHTCIANGELVLSGDVREESDGGLPEATSERITIRLDKAVINIGD